MLHGGVPHGALNRGAEHGGGLRAVHVAQVPAPGRRRAQASGPPVHCLDWIAFDSVEKKGIGIDYPTPAKALSPASFLVLCKLQMQPSLSFFSSISIILLFGQQKSPRSLSRSRNSHVNRRKIEK